MCNLISRTCAHAALAILGMWTTIVLATTPAYAGQSTNVSLNGPAAATAVGLVETMITSGVTVDSLRTYDLYLLRGNLGDAMFASSLPDGSLIWFASGSSGGEIRSNGDKGVTLSGSDLLALYLASRSASNAGIDDLSTLAYVSIYWPADVDVGIRYIDFTTRKPPLSTENGLTVFHCDTQVGFVVNLSSKKITRKPMVC